MNLPFSKYFNKPKNLLPGVIDEKLKKTDANRLITAYHLPRVRQDIASWREAVMEMERPYNITKYRVKVQLLYQDTILNGHVFACVKKRKDMVLLKKWAIVDEKNNINEEWTKWIQQKWFKDLLNYILDAQFYGYSFINWTGAINDKLENVHILQRQFISPDRLQIATYPYSPVGHDIDTPDIYPWTLYVTTPSDHGISPCGYGLFYTVGIYEIILRNLIGQNADFCELFSQPIRWAKSTKREGEEYDELERAIKNMGSSAYIITEPNDEITLLTSSTTGTGYQGYDNLELRCEKKISKILLGHADALDSVPGKLGSQQGGKLTPQEQALADCEAADIEFASNILNDQFIDKVRRIGFDIPAGLQFASTNDKEEQELANEQDKQYTATSVYVNTFAQAGYEVDADWIAKRLDIPIKKKAVTETPPPDEGEPLTNLFKSPKNPYPSEHAARIIEPSKFDPKSFRRKNIAKGIDLIIGKLKGEKTITTQAYRFAVENFTDKEAKQWLKDHDIKYISFHAATTGSRFMEKPVNLLVEKYIPEQLIEDIFHGKVRDFDHELFQNIREDIMKAVRKAFGRSRVSNKTSEGLSPRDNLYYMMEANTFQFSAEKASAEVGEINQVFEKGMPYNDFKKEVDKVNTTYNENYLKTEYGTAYATCLNGAVYADRSKDKDLFPYVRWNQIDRPTKREEHEELDGMTFRIDELEAIPPCDWNCGCILDYLADDEVEESEVNTMDDFKETLENMEPTASGYENYYQQVNDAGFLDNQAKSGKVFDLDAQYNGLPKNFSHEDQGIKQISELDAGDYPKINIQERTDSRLKDETIHDYSGRTLQTPQNELSQQMKNSSEYVKSIVSRPDEVYLDNNKYTYVKFYGEGARIKAMCVNVRISKDGLIINKFGEIDDAIRLRQTLLIYKKP